MSKWLWLAVPWLAASMPAVAQAPVAAPPVVVELFTSQGCSSCPPADAYLGELARQPGIVALGFHVDYWNYIGWTDPYALPLATQRQRNYAHRLGLPYVYTPQMVIDGTLQGIGSERDKIATLIAAARRQPLRGPTLSLTRQGGGWQIHVGAAPVTAAAASAPPSATLWLAALDRAQRTAVARGENQGELARDYEVVRRFTAVATWHGQKLDLAAPDAGIGNEAAVLLQRDGTGPILAAAVAATP